MSLFGVRPEKEKALLERMQQLSIKDSDLMEKFIRSGGKGGQNVNKTATCVYLKHIPSGIEVKVQKERTQALNRFLARRQLIEKYESQVLGLRTQRDATRDKIRKQKARKRRRNSSGRIPPPANNDNRG